MNHLRLMISTIGCIVCLYSPLYTAAANALDDIYALADHKKFDTALQQLNKFLSNNPSKAEIAQARFLKGLILTETKQHEEAIEVFSSLSKDFPELPEPYNNLAVLYAEQGQFVKAQEALLLAIKAHPKYATAHENLGDIYAKMASQSYANAIELNQDNPTLISKLHKVKTLFAEGKIEPPPATGTVPVQSAAVMPPKKSSSNKSAPTPNKTQASASPSPATQQNSTTSATPNHTNASKTGETTKSIQEVQQTVYGWAEAWSSKNLNHYIDAYSTKFTPIGKVAKSRSVWESERRRIIGKPGQIQVQIADLKIIMLTENRAQATFLQNYQSKNYKDSVKKTLSFEREKNQWKIVREYADE